MAHSEKDPNQLLPKNRDYFVEMDDEYRNNIYRTIRGNDLDFIDIDQIVLVSPFDDVAFKSMCKELEIEPKPNSLQEMHNTQVINICHSITRLNLEDQKSLIEYAKTNKSPQCIKLIKS